MTAKQIALDAINAMPSGASFNRGKSKQDYATPQDFRDAVIKRFGWPSFDLAADETNAFFIRKGICNWFDEGDNSLLMDWHKEKGNLWLNPPFGNIAPWARKCHEEAEKGADILLLLPAAVGSNWFQEYVHRKATVYFLNPRLSFDGKNSFPKDCVLAHYFATIKDGSFSYETWRWK